MVTKKSKRGGKAATDKRSAGCPTGPPLPGLPGLPPGHPGPPHPGGPPQHNGQNVLPHPPPNGDVRPHPSLMDPNMPPNAMRPQGPPMPPHGMHPGPPHGPAQPPHMDSNFVQQQNQIFVFSTSMANEGAKAVQSGQFKTILDFHANHPRTKQFLQKNSMKLQPGPPRPPHMFPGGMRPDNPAMMAKTGPQQQPPMMGPGDSMTSVAQWVQQQNAHLQQGPTFSPPPVSLQESGTFSPPPITAQVPGDGMPPTSWGGPQGPGGPVSSPVDFGMMAGGNGGGNFGGMPGPGGGPASMLSQNKVPNENLTPEQLQRREEQLAKMRKIQQMLFPEQQGGPGPGGAGGPGMGPGGMMGPGGPGGPGGMHPGMMPSQPNMPPGSQPNMPGSQPGMMHSPGAMVPMNSNTMGPGGPYVPGMPPPNWENMTPAQREWFKLQNDFYSDKRRKQVAQQMHQMQMPGGPGGMPPGPSPPSYFSLQRRPGPMSPTSANFNGPIPSPHLRGPSPVPGDPFLGFPGGPRRPGPGNMNFPGPNFDPSMMEPGMGPGGGMFPFKDDMMHGPPGGKMPMIHRAGNPEQFNPADIIPGPGTPNSTGPTKPPPSYAQAQKRKRSGDDMDDPYKKLQPAPSPQQFSYLNQFEGQELTITKQLNLAYQEPVGSPSNTTPTTSQQQQQPPQQQPPKSGPGSVEAHHVNSPLPPSSLSVPSPLPASSAPGSRPSSAQPPASQTPTTSGASSQRLSHFEPGGTTPRQSTTVTSTSATVTTAVATTSLSTKSTMSNITSSSLANLAKGVEHLSNQMQQNMMQGGPFHNIQVQGQMADVEECSDNPASSLSTSGPGSVPAVVSSPLTTAAHSQQGPSVNNTYVNATMSIGQLNIQSVNPGGGPGANGQPPGNYNASMQVQQMNNEQMQHMGPGGPGPQPAPTSGPGPSGPRMPPPPMDSLIQGMRPGGPPMPQHLPPQRAPSPGMVNSPGYRNPGPPNPVGNANVQIQAKAPNTIQYLPANPPASSGPVTGPSGPIRPPMKDMDMMGDMCYPMDGRTSGPKMGPSYGPGGGGGLGELLMGPGPGQMGGGQMGPGPGQMGPGPGQMGPGQMGPGQMGPMGSGGHRMTMGQAQSMSMGGMHPQSMMMQQSSAMSQQGGMGYSSPPGPMHPGPHRGPSPVMQDMMQMQGQHMGPMQGGPGGPMMGPGMRPDMMGGGPQGPGYQAQFQQFQQQLYAQGRPRGAGPQMNPNMPGGGHPGGGPQGGMPPGGGGPMMGGPPQSDMMGPGGMGGMQPGMMSPGPRPGGPAMMGGPMGPGPNMGGMNMMSSLP